MGWDQDGGEETDSRRVPSWARRLQCKLDSIPTNPHGRRPPRGEFVGTQLANSRIAVVFNCLQNDELSLWFPENLTLQMQTFAVGIRPRVAALRNGNLVISYLPGLYTVFDPSGTVVIPETQYAPDAVAGTSVARFKSDHILFAYPGKLTILDSSGNMVLRPSVFPGGGDTQAISLSNGKVAILSDYIERDVFGQIIVREVNLAIIEDPGAGAAIANSPPVAPDVSFGTEETATVEITLTAADPEGDDVDFTVVTNPTIGTMGGTPPFVTYAANEGFLGMDSFTYLANDGELDGNVGTISINVTAIISP